MKVKLSDQQVTAHVLADHLEAVQVLIRGLRELKVDRCGETMDETEQPLNKMGELRRFAKALNAIEMALFARIVRSRSRCEQLVRSNSAMRPQARLFLAGTQPMMDLLEEFADPCQAHFDRITGLRNFLERRALITPAQELPECADAISTGQAYLIGGVVPLAALSENVETMLDGIDTLYAIYEPIVEGATETEAATATATATETAKSDSTSSVDERQSATAPGDAVDGEKAAPETEATPDDPGEQFASDEAAGNGTKIAQSDEADQDDGGAMSAASGNRESDSCGHVGEEEKAPTSDAGGDAEENAGAGDGEHSSLTKRVEDAEDDGLTSRIEAQLGEKIQADPSIMVGEEADDASSAEQDTAPEAAGQTGATLDKADEEAEAVADEVLAAVATLICEDEDDSEKASKGEISPDDAVSIGDEVSNGEADHPAKEENCGDEQAHVAA